MDRLNKNVHKQSYFFFSASLNYCMSLVCTLLVTLSTSVDASPYFSMRILLNTFVS